jgi:hypothetical protein
MLVIFNYGRTLTEAKAQKEWPSVVGDVKNNGHDVCALTSDREKDMIKDDFELMRSQGFDPKLGAAPGGIMFDMSLRYEIGYKYCAEAFGVEAKDILLIDDYAPNVEFARKMGAQGIHFDAEKGGVPAVREELVRLKVLPQ